MLNHAEFLSMLLSPAEKLAVKKIIIFRLLLVVSFGAGVTDATTETIATDPGE